MVSWPTDIVIQYTTYWKGEGREGKGRVENISCKPTRKEEDSTKIRHQQRIPSASFKKLNYTMDFKITYIRQRLTHNLN